MWENRLKIKLTLISKFMASQPGKQTNAIDIAHLKEAVAFYLCFLRKMFPMLYILSE